MSPRRASGKGGTGVRQMSDTRVTTSLEELLVEVPDDGTHTWPTDEVEVWSEFQRRIIRQRRSWGLDTKRRYFIGRCVLDNSILLFTTGPKGLEGKSTWKGRCSVCGRKATDDPRPIVIQETTDPEPEGT